MIKFSDKSVAKPKAVLSNQELRTAKKSVKNLWRSSFVQYIDNIGYLCINLSVFIFIDEGVTWLYKNNFVDTTSPAQYITIQDIEKLILAIVWTLQVIISVKLILSLVFDVISNFLETSQYRVSFNRLTGWQKWLLLLGFFYVATQLYLGIVRGIA
jgi:hypothetical protein